MINRRRAILITVTLSGFALSVPSGCTDPSDPPAARIERTAADPGSGATLTTRIDTDEIGIADRIWVLDRWVVPEGYVAFPGERDWSSTSWTVVRTDEAPMRATDSGFVVRRRTLIEPFLPGEYTIPPARLRLSPLGDDDAEHEEIVLENDPITVTVTGVLPDEDEGKLNPIAEAGVPEEEHAQTRTMLWIGVSFALALVSGGAYALFSRRAQDDSATSLADELRAIMDSDEDEEGYERLSRVFERLDRRLRETSEFQEMIRVCDRARFGRDAPERATPARLARHALELLGHDIPPTGVKGGEA